MKNYSLVIKLVVCCALVVYCTFGLMPSPLYAQGRTLTAEQLEAIVKPSLAQCTPPSGETMSGQIDPASIIPTSNAKEFPKATIAKTLHGMWRGQVFGDYNKELSVDYFWIIDMQRYEGLIFALRNGNQTLGDLKPVANAPKISYLMCAHEGYIPSSEGGSQIHEFVKVSDSIADAPLILKKGTGVDAQGTLSDLWQAVVASGYFKTLPAVAFAGALFKPIQLELVPSTIGPAQVSLRWNGEYYGGGATSLKFEPGVPIHGVEYTQFIGTTTTSGDYLVSSPGNGNLYKVESLEAEYSYDLAFDAVTFGPLQGEVEAQIQIGKKSHTGSTQKALRGRKSKLR